MTDTMVTKERERQILIAKIESIIDGLPVWALEDIYWHIKELIVEEAVDD
jgi:hypothetical protein